MPELCFVLLVTLTVSAATGFRIVGHVTHGVNTYNSKLLVDFSSSSRIFTAAGLVHEIGVVNPGGKNATVITDATAPNSLLANVNAFTYQSAFGLKPGIGPFNIPIAQTPTLTIFSADINDRVKPSSFASSSDLPVIGTPYLAQGVNDKVTVKQWSMASAVISGRCRRGRASVRIKLTNGLPNGIYTLWDIGVTNPLKNNEQVSVGPFGGLPNVIATNDKGAGDVKRRINYCPTDSCQGAQRCTLYVSLFYHFDHMVYGGSPAMDFAGQAIGQIGTNHIQFFMNGDELVSPLNTR